MKVNISHNLWENHRKDWFIYVLPYFALGRYPDGIAITLGWLLGEIQIDIFTDI